MLKLRPSLQRSLQKCLFVCLVLLTLCMLYLNLTLNTNLEVQIISSKQIKQLEQSQCSNTTYDQLRNIPLIFIGGTPRSGTTLMRAILDSHPEIKCGTETHILPIYLQFVARPLQDSKDESQFLGEINRKTFDDASLQFLLDIFFKHTPLSKHLCKKDPFLLMDAEYLKHLFPNSKFIFMIRDGRAMVHSAIQRKVKISHFNVSDYKTCLKSWNNFVTTMDQKCNSLGKSCFRMHYEQLVLHPVGSLKRLFEFLNIDWNDSVLYHHQHILNGSVKLSLMERSTDQVIKPISTDSLYSWIGSVPMDVEKNLEEIAPMLSKLGYDLDCQKISYGKPDPFVIQNQIELEKDQHRWNNRTKLVKKQIRTFFKDLEFN